ncbi:hypothetical protein P5V15_003292 [Pogonomyrmex californicus]
MSNAGGQVIYIFARAVIGLQPTICQRQISAKSARYKRNSVFGFMLYSKRYIVHRTLSLHRLLQIGICDCFKHPSMANYTRYAFVIAIIVSIVCGEDSNEFENVDRNLLGLNLPYGRGLDNEMQLAKLLLMVPRFCHPKRNSELINSLLGLPKNMHNAGK